MYGSVSLENLKTESKYRNGKEKRKEKICVNRYTVQFREGNGNGKRKRDCLNRLHLQLERR